MSDHAFAHNPAMDALPRTRTPETTLPAPSAERRRVVQVLFEGRGWLRFRLAVDAVLLVLGVVSAIVGAPDGDVGAGTGLVWLLPPLTLVLLALWGLYRDRTALRLVDGIGQMVAATALPTIAIIAIAASLGVSRPASPATWRGRSCTSSRVGSGTGPRRSSSTTSMSPRCSMTREPARAQSRIWCGPMP